MPDLYLGTDWWWAVQFVIVVANMQDLQPLWTALVCAKRKVLLHRLLYKFKWQGKGDHQVGDLSLKKKKNRLSLPSHGTPAANLFTTAGGQNHHWPQMFWTESWLILCKQLNSTSQNASSCVNYAEPHNLWVCFDAVFKLLQSSPLCCVHGALWHSTVVRCSTYNTYEASVSFSFWATIM